MLAKESTFEKLIYIYIKLKGLINDIPGTLYKYIII